MRLLHDFYPIWAAARAAVKGANPYDDNNVINQLILAGVTLDAYPGGFHNPPWTIWLFYPFGLLPLSVAKPLWLALLLCCTFLSVYKSLQLIKSFHSGKVLEKFPFLILALFSFYPLGKLILIGQTTVIPLFGLTIFLWGMTNRRDLLAGVSLSLTLLKPQLFLPVYVLVLAFSIKRSRYLILLGCFGAWVLQAGLSEVLVPGLSYEFLTHIFNLYKERAMSYQVTLGHLLAVLFDNPHFTSIIFAMSIVLAICLTIFTRNFSPYNFVLMLCLGVVCAPYAWSHDSVLLLLPFLLLAHSLYLRVPRLAALILFVVGGISYIYVSGDLGLREQAMIVWPMVLSITWLMQGRSFTETPPPQISPLKYF